LQQLGDRIGEYTIERELGRGSFGTTYKAFLTQDESQENPVAIKVLSTDAPVERLKNEIWALREINHINLPRCIDEGRLDDGSSYLVMTFAPGESLRDIHKRNLKHGNFCSIVETITILRGVLDALVCLHSKSIVHRDVKDANTAATP
jgi:serine/threonine protein kinase